MMQYNVCKTCGADNGRAGMLINDECLNCHDTRKNGFITIYAHLTRKDGEIKRTFDILKTKQATTDDTVNGQGICS